jgi:hypothetical protein
VRSRQFVCNDSRVIDLLGRFVPVVDTPSNYAGWNVKVDESKLQFRLVKQVLEQTAYHQISGAQGLYVVTPSGRLIAGTTQHSNPQLVLAEMRKGLDAYARLPKSERLLPREPDARTDKLDIAAEEVAPPPGGLVLRMVSRGLPFPGVSEQDTRHPSFYKLDRVWYTKEQARAFVPAEMRRGAKSQVRGATLALIVRLNLGTFIQPNPAWNGEDVRKAVLKSEIKSVTDGVAQLEFTGEAEMKADNAHNNRSFSAKLLGKASYDTRSQKFETFELLAVGTHTMGDRGEDTRATGPKSTPLGVLFTINGTNANDDVVPHYYHHYDWVVRSAR